MFRYWSGCLDITLGVQKLAKASKYWYGYLDINIITIQTSGWKQIAFFLDHLDSHI